jgi:hypothetical protein
LSDDSVRSAAERATRPAATPARAAPRRSPWTLFLVLLICLAPVLGAVYAYFTQWRPDGINNYGTLVEPQRPVPPAGQLTLTQLDGTPFDLRSLAGKWVMLTVDGGECPEACAKKLFIMRQTHASTGKSVDRIERVWLVSDREPLHTEVIRAYDGMHMVRADPAQLAKFLAVPAGSENSLQAIEQHIWLIDPIGNQMMRFPENPDPILLRKDLGKLLHASRIG